MPQLPDNGTPFVFHDGTLEHFATDDRYAFDGTGYVLLDNGGILARNTPTNMSDSWEMEIDSNNSIQGTCPEETIPQIDRCIVSMTDSSVTSRDYVIVTDKAQPVVAMLAGSDPAVRQNSAECSWVQLSNRHQDGFTGLSISTASGCPNRQSFEAPGAFWTPDHLFSVVQGRELGFSWESVGPHPVQCKKPSTTNPLGIPESQDSCEVSHSPARAGALPTEDLSGQHWPQGSTQMQHTSQPLFTNPTMNVAAYEDLLLYNRFGLDLARTSSPENTELIYHESPSSAENNVLGMNTIIPTHGSTQCHRLRGNEDMRPIATKPFKTRSSPTQRPKRISRVTTNDVQKKKSTRTLPEGGLENYRKTRSKGACVDCKCMKKQVSRPQKSPGSELHPN
jgi:hypothetical protein